jgi:hypothetical protein
MRRSLVAAVLGGVAAIIATDLLTDYLGLADSLALWGIAGGAFLVVGLLVGLRSPNTWATNAFLIALGIIVGVIADTVLQESVRGQSRNLWPFAIVFFLILAVPTAGCGLWVGRLIARRHAVQPK